MTRVRTIVTPRLRIEPFGEEHLTERYVGWLNDPEVTRYSEQRYRRHTLESCRAYLGTFDWRSSFFWGVVVEEGELGHIGNLNAYLEPMHSLADVGILIGEAGALGQGYATEAWLGVCDYLFREAGVRKVTAGTMAGNGPMLGLMKRTGMSDDGRRVRHFLWEGQEVDVVNRAFFKEEWERRYPGGPFSDS